MMVVLFATVLYFLPAIIGHNKRDFGGILAVNLLFGWTIVGWIIALIWACAAETKPHVLVVAGPGGGRYCSQCGTVGAPGGALLRNLRKADLRDFRQKPLNYR